MYRNHDILILILIQCVRVYLGQYQCCENKNCTKISNCPYPRCYIGIRKSDADKNVKIINITRERDAIYGCWIWSHENSFCPSIKSECRYTHDGHNFKFFCCNGNLCNKFIHLLCDNTVKKIVLTKKPTTTHKTAVKLTHSNLPQFILIIVALSIIIFVSIMCIGAWIFISRVRFRKVFLRQHFNSVSEMLSFKMDNKQESAPPSIFIHNASNYYRKSKKISNGKFGEVWLGDLIMNDDSNNVNLRLTQEIAASYTAKNLPSQVAIKVFQNSSENSWENELKIYQYIRNNCPQILHLIGFDKFKLDVTMEHNVADLWLITSYMDQGSLFDCLQSSRLSWSQVVSVCREIAAGVSYLHDDSSYNQHHHQNPTSDTCMIVKDYEKSSLNSVHDPTHKPSIAHRDLKSRNILIGDNWNRVCIGDMGLAVCFHRNTPVSEFQSQVGTFRYMSPEVLEGVVNFSRDAFLAIDIYAMALIMWEVISQTDLCIDDTLSQPEPYAQPFQCELGNNITMGVLQDWVITKRKRPKFPKHLQEFEPARILWKTIEECWDKEAEARLTSSCVYERLQNIYASQNMNIL